jgi:phospholipid/cholesterol/gamma-HCH transport system ATP-binding protein
MTPKQTASNISIAVDDPTRTIPAIEFRHVLFGYEDRAVLEDVSFKVMRGELLVVLGSSGGGKSTILKLAIGLIKPDEGQILIDGEEISGYDEEALNRVRQRVGMDFQDGALFDSLSVYDNVAFRCHENGVPEDVIEEEVGRLLSFVDLEDAVEMMPAELSGGMRIRAGIARALAGDPHLVLLDEPTGGLDPPSAREVCELVVKLRDFRDVSSIFVTHGLENVRFLASTYATTAPDGEAVMTKEADQLCLVNTRIMMLRDGRVSFHGTDEELLETEDPYIRDFLLL